MTVKLEFVQQSLIIDGKIDFSNAEYAYKQGLTLILNQSHFPVVIDLSKLEHGNTLVLAVFVQWLRKVPQFDDLVFKAMPDKMLKIVQACHLEKQLKMLT